MSQTAHGEGGAPEPLVRVVRGTPTPEELAALVSVLVTGARAAAGRQPVARSLWAASARPGFARRPGGWRASASPGIRVL